MRFLDSLLSLCDIMCIPYGSVAKSVLDCLHPRSQARRPSPCLDLEGGGGRCEPRNRVSRPGSIISYVQYC